MKATLKLLILLFISLSCTKAIAQQEYSHSQKVSFQVRAGANISNVRANHDDISIEGDDKVGFNIGVIADISLGKDFYLHPGVLFTTKGVKVDDIEMETSIFEAEMNAMYIQIPIQVGYKMQFQNWDNRFGISLGPYFAYGVAGKTDFIARRGGTNTTVNTFDSNFMWNKFDMGIGIELYFELKKVVFTGGVETGFTRAWKKEYLTDNINPRNDNVYLCIGYKF
jgi:hypothetical protein